MFQVLRRESSTDLAFVSVQSDRAPYRSPCAQGDGQLFRLCNKPS